MSLRAILNAIGIIERTFGHVMRMLISGNENSCMWSMRTTRTVTSDMGNKGILSICVDMYLIMQQTCKSLVEYMRVFQLMQNKS